MASTQTGSDKRNTKSGISIHITIPEAVIIIFYTALLGILPILFVGLVGKHGPVVYSASLEELGPGDCEMGC